ncbi:MAG: DUF86 domain-containing protein [Nanoarchaeota archaeon]
MSKYDLYLNDILRAIALIEKSLKGKKFEDFKKQQDLIDANAMRLQIIGESSTKLPNSLKKKHKEVDWNKLTQTRNILSHAYFAINVNLLWDIINKQIPLIKKTIQDMKKELK